MRLEIDTDEFVRAIWVRLRPRIEAIKAQSAPALLSRNTGRPSDIAVADVRRRAEETQEAGRP